MRKALTGLFGLLAASAAFAQHAHEHGVAELRVALAGKTLVIEFESPLDNLVGFEHAPKTDAQRRALAEAEARLRRFDGLVVLPAAAACKLREVELESPYPQEHDGHAHEGREGHSELAASYTLDCAQPEHLDALRVVLFDTFPRLRSLRAETATPRGQSAHALSKAKSRLPL